MTAIQTRSFDLGVHYGQAYLIDEIDDAVGPGDLLDDHPAHPVGIIRVKDDSAFLITGRHTGTVGFSVTVADHDPGADTDGYEDAATTDVSREIIDRYLLQIWPQRSPYLGWSRARAGNSPTGAARADIRKTSVRDLPGQTGSPSGA
ncbi:hypothetical protein [Planobispora takensis]|uniref:Uncharacterized protein n=1 Tax=Planobispora takensis TaxID=1367882 RepID=A0A8J3SXJ5_9ACTN|nr:hypothetical protein [Planobispora takensis]GII02459.1 hypothetical protein Pta02_44670 [Planobispora takensis]